MNFRKTLLLTFLSLIYLTIRLINFPYFLNFSSDQGLHSLAALDLYRHPRFILIGPELTSAVAIGRHIFYGPLVYYLYLFFLTLGRFDPLSASSAMIIFGALMIFPLYLGLERLTTRANAILITLLFALFPFYIDYSRFLWNPNFLLVLIPGLIYLMGRLNHNGSNSSLSHFLIFLYVGLLTQLHYSFFLAFFLLTLYYVLQSGVSLKRMFIQAAGFFVGLSPLVVFEIKHNFYNLRTLFLYLEIGVNRAPLGPHHFLGLSFLCIVLLLVMSKISLRRGVLILILITFATIDLIKYTPIPPHAFGMVDYWNYLEEEKVFEIIKSQNLTSFNVVNLPYNTLASVQKYLLAKDEISGNFDNYVTNKYLFVINKDDKYFDNPAYEVATFRPSTLIRIWKINDSYNLYLLARNI